MNLGIIALPASFVNSFLEYVNKKLAINFRKRLTDYFHKSYLKGMIFYQLGNLDSRITNPDQRLTADIEKWANSLSLIYSNFSKPTLDIILFSRKLSDLVGWKGPGAVILWYFLSGVLLKFVSPPFGKLIAIEQKLEGDYRASQTDLVHHSEEVAFYRGNEWEKQRINTMFSVTSFLFSGSHQALRNNHQQKTVHGSLRFDACQIRSLYGRLRCCRLACVRA